MSSEILRKYANIINEAQNNLSLQQLATISDIALDNAYHYGRSSPGNTFGWQANLKSAEFANQMIAKGVTDIEQISDAIHKGWNVTAKAFVQNPNQFDDTAKLKEAGKLEAKLQQREKLMNINYAQLPEDEKEKDRVVARALMKALTGKLTEATKSLPVGKELPPSTSPEKPYPTPYGYEKWQIASIISDAIKNGQATAPYYFKWNADVHEVTDEMARSTHGQQYRQLPEVPAAPAAAKTDLVNATDDELIKRAMKDSGGGYRYSSELQYWQSERNKQRAAAGKSPLPPIRY